ncbi:MAG: hypothetical protein HY589_05995, partial [Candidatus Omnitrophica bacterium]|nr:hypothetical protein [Candidatus Omnitrophota bacterium]
YDVYYEVSKFEVDCVYNVSVMGTVNIDGITFLVVNTKEFTKEKSSFILFSGVRAILASSVAKPDRIFDFKGPRAKAE